MDNFDEWWNEDYDDKDNPFEKDSFGYWAYAGWCAAMQVEKQEPVATRNVFSGLIEVEWGKSVPIGTKLYAAPPIREWVKDGE